MPSPAALSNAARSLASRSLIVVLLLGLAACGQKTGLSPLAGKQQPVAPYGREAGKSTDALLTPPVQAIPERSVELRRPAIGSVAADT